LIEHLHWKDSQLFGGNSTNTARMRLTIESRRASGSDAGLDFLGSGAKSAYLFVWQKRA
jgi:hypothetical protein